MTGRRKSGYNTANKNGVGTRWATYGGRSHATVAPLVRSHYSGQFTPCQNFVIFLKYH